ncbi:glycosyltransferase [Fictibacillus enclensis]|uniref:glycosyltransferase n=1 Tax=Fictibacillus enclensis TaxID=1017270 RepID=UPI0024BFEFC4|nr:glycosyltransferase [Fictibacillus enclensis]WHY75028.1 glycosyltransferase [Fictibacillus enclensis]
MMKKKILIASFDLAIGGVERSLIGLLNSIDYTKYDVDLMLFKHEGEFLPLLPEGPRLLNEVAEYTTFRKSIKQVMQQRAFPILFSRLFARCAGALHGRLVGSAEPGYYIIQYGWKFALPYLPKLKGEYDTAISFLWPHYFVAEKVKAKKKIGWIHTDYSTITVNQAEETKMWERMDHLVAVSNGCRDSFLSVYPHFQDRLEVIENILTPEFIYEQAQLSELPKLTKRPNETVLVTVGRLSHAKGIDDAARACRKIVDEGYQVKWYIVGYGPLESELKRLIDELNINEHFILLGKKTNPYPFINACDIYVQPSRYEGKAVTVREAQILEKPVLITDFPTAKSQLEDGIDGVITQQGVEGVTEGIIQLINNQQKVASLRENTKRRSYGNAKEVEKLYELIEMA